MLLDMLHKNKRSVYFTCVGKTKKFTKKQLTTEEVTRLNEMIQHEQRVLAASCNHYREFPGVDTLNKY